MSTPAGTITPEQILDALRHVEEPDLKRDLVTLNMVRDVRIEGNKVSFTVVLTTPACPLKDMIRNACVTAVKHLVDKNLEVDVNLTANVSAQPLKEGPLAGVRNVIAVASGKGGVGKSTVAANLAVALAQAGARTGLLDADIYGPSIPLMFDLVDQRPFMETINGKDMIVPFERYGVKLASIGFLVQAETPVVWRGPMASNATRQLISDTNWGELDYLVVDMPPGTGDIHITLAQQFPLTGVVIVTTPQPVAVADAHKALAMYRSPQINKPCLGVVENMSYFTPDDMPDRKYYIFGEGGGRKLADAFGIDLLGALPIVERIREDADNGRPAALRHETPLGKAFYDIAAAVARQVSILNSVASPAQVQV